MDIVGPYADQSNWIEYDVKAVAFGCGGRYMKVAIYSAGLFTYTDTAWCLNIGSEEIKKGDRIIGNFVKVLEKDRLTCDGIEYPNQILLVKTFLRY